MVFFLALETKYQSLKIPSFHSIQLQQQKIHWIQRHTNKIPILCESHRDITIHEPGIIDLKSKDIPSGHELLGRPAMHNLMERLKQEAQKKKAATFQIRKSHSNSRIDISGADQI